MTRGQKPKYNPSKHQRKSIRLREHDYSQAGAYFITIVTHQRENIFGEIVDEVVVLNDCGASPINVGAPSQNILITWNWARM